VLDFKTGEEADPGQHGQYVKQVRGYMKALQRPDGPLVKGYLYYLQEDNLVEVTAQ